jgi:hypothetical protein
MKILPFYRLPGTEKVNVQYQVREKFYYYKKQYETLLNTIDMVGIWQKIQVAFSMVHL